MNRVLGIDAASSGAAGDMLVVALAALFSERKELEAEIKNILTQAIGQEVNFEIKQIKKKGISGYQLKSLKPKLKIGGTKITEIFKQLESELGDLGNSILQKAWTAILEAEKEIHQSNDVSLHELGAFDTVFDIFTAAYLIDRLDVHFLTMAPVNTGMGTVKTSHGILPVPAPATQRILEKFQLPTVADGSGELLTPTGAAILGALFSSLNRTKQVVWKKSTFGFGNKELEDRANVVRVRIGEVQETESEITVLETNIDDVSGEMLGDAIIHLMEKGALDVSYHPIFTKKNRPGWQIQVITKRKQADELSQLLMRLTGTLGVRIRNVHRHIGQRKIKKVKIKIDNRFFEVRMKVGPFTQKIEFEDLRRLANELGKTPLEIHNTLKVVQKEE